MKRIDSALLSQTSNIQNGGELSRKHRAVGEKQSQLFSPLMLLTLGLAGVVTESEASGHGAVPVDAIRAIEEALVRQGMGAEQARILVEQVLSIDTAAGRQQALAQLSAIINDTVQALGLSQETPQMVAKVVDAIAAEVKANPAGLDLVNPDTLHSILDRSGLFSGQNLDNLIAQIQSHSQSVYGELSRAEAEGASLTDTIADGIAGAGEAIGAAAASGGEMIAALLGAAAVAGGGGGGSSVVAAVASSSGTVVKGPISGATVFRDMDGDYVKDAGEYEATTAADGSYTLQGSGGTIVASGGTDRSTGDAFSGTLAAPSTATVVTPLTTLLAANANLTVTELQTALGITVDPLSYNPFAAGVDAAEALAAEKAAATVQNLLSDLASTVANNSGGAVSLAAAVEFVAETVAAQLDGATVAVDLSNSTTLSAIATAVQTAAATGVGDTSVAVTITNDAVSTLVTSVAADNTTIKNAADLDAVIAAQDEIQVSLQNDTGVAGDNVTTDGALTIVGADTGSTLAYSTDGTTWTDMSGDSDSLVFIPASNTVTLSLSGNTPGSSTPFTVALELPVTATEGGSGLTLAVPADTTLTPTATLDGKSVDTGISVNNSAIDELLLVEEGGGSLPSVTLKLASLLGQISSSNTLFSSAQEALLGNEGTYTVSLSSTDFGFVYGGEVVRTISMELSVSSSGYEADQSVANLSSEGVQLVDYDAEGDAQATSLIPIFNTDTSTLTITGAALNLTNLTALTDGDDGTTGTQPVLNFWLNDLPLVGNTDGSTTSVQIRETPTSGGPVTKTFAFTLDHTAPAAPTVLLSNDTGANANDQITSDGSLAAHGENGATYQYSADGSTWGSAVPTAVEGSNTVYARQLDGAGNASPATTFTYTLDTKTTTIDTTGTVIADGYLNADDDDNDLVISGVTTNASTGDTVTVTFDGTDYTGTVAADGSYSVTIDASSLQALAAGDVAVSAIVAGQVVNGAASSTFVYDKTAPTVTMDAPAVLSDNIINAAESAAVVTITGTSTFSNGQTVTLTFTDSESNTVTATGTVANNVYSIDVPANALAPLTEGSVSVAASVTDAAGNTGTSDSLSFTYDATAPAAPTLSMNSDGTIEVAGLESGASWSYTLDGGDAVTGSDTSITMTNSGSYVLSVSQTDASGNAGSAATANVVVGTTGDDKIAGTSSVELINLNGGTDTVTLSSGDTVSGFTSGDAIDLSVLLGPGSGAGYTTENSVPAGSASSPYEFRNGEINGNQATVDLYYVGTSLTSDDSFSVDVDFYYTSNVSGAAITASHSLIPVLDINGTTGQIAGVGTGNILGGLTNGDLLASITFVLSDTPTSHIFAAESAKFDDGTGIQDVAAPLTSLIGTSSTVATGSYAYVNDGATLSTVGDNEVHIAQSFADGETTVQLQYDTDSSAGTTTASEAISMSLTSAAALGLVQSDFVFTDNTAPVVVITAAGGTDNIASSADAAVTGTTTEPGTDVTIKSGSTTLGTATPDALGGWSYTLTSENLTTLGESSTAGDKSLTATQTDGSGNVGTSTAFTLTVDTTAPTAATVAAIGDTDKTSAEATNAGGVITVNAATGDTATVTLTGQSGTVTKTVSGNDSTQVVALDSADLTMLGDGAVTISTVTTDAAGNAATADTTGGFTLDTAAPDALTVALTEDTATAADNISSNGAVTVTGSESGATVEYSTDGGSTWGSSFTASVGGNNVTVRQTDTAGNTSATTNLIFTLDTSAAAPTVVLATDSGSASDDLITNDGSLTVTGETGATVEYSIDSGTSWGSSFAATEGDNTVQVRQTDVAGNVSDATTLTFTLDTTIAAPTVALTTDAGSSASDTITNDGTLSVTDTETAATIEYSIDGTSWSATAPATDTAGANTVLVRQTDTAGNVSDATTARFVVDTTAPATAIITSSDVVISQTPTVTGTAEVGSTVALTIGGATYSTTATDGSWSVDLATATPASGTLTAADSYSASVVVTDVAGNAASAAAQTIAVNADAPVITSAALSTTAAPIVSGTAVADSTVTVIVAGATYTVTATEGTWSVDLSSTTPDNGTLSLTADGSAANAVSVEASNAVGVNVTQQLMIDSVAPTAVVTLSDAALIVGETSDVTITFSESVTGFTAADITAGNAAVTELRSTDDGTTWSALLTPAANTDAVASNTISIAAASYSDSLGNSGGAGSATYSVDTTTPTLETISSSITSFTADTQGNIDVATLTFDFSEAPTGFELADITGETNGTITDLRADGSDATIYYATYTPDADVASLNEAITVSASAFSDAAGNSAAVTATTLSLTGDTRTPEAGTAQDGYISGALVFRDTNGNGELDTGEDSTTTDASGNFLLAPGTGDLILTGGTDISTGHAYTGTLKAPEGSTVVNTMTTLVAELVAADTGGGDAATKLASAQTALKTAFGITENVDFTTYDPIQAAATAEAAGSTDAAALAIAKTMAQVNVIVNTVSKTVAAAVGSSEATEQAASQSIFTSLASTIQSSGAATDLTDTTTLESLAATAVTEASTDAGLDTAAAATAAAKVSAVSSAVASVVSASVSKVAAQTDLTGMVKATGAATGTVASKLQSSIENEIEIDAADLNSKLDGFIAAQEVGTIVPPSLTLSEIATDGVLTAVEAATTLTITGTATGLNGETVTIMVGSDSYFATVADGTFSVTVPSADLQDLNEGTVRITANASDGNGAAATTARDALFVDTTAPAVTSGATATVNENSGAGQTVYTVTTDTAAILTPLSGTDAAAFSLNAGTGEVILLGNPDFETQSNYSFTINTADTLGNTGAQTVTLAVNDVDETGTAPAAPTLTATNGAVVVSGLENGASWQFSTDGGTTWSDDTEADVVAASAANITLLLSGNTPVGNTPFSVSMDIPVGLTVSGGVLGMAAAVGSITPTATLNNSSVNLGVTLTNADLDSLLSLATSTGAGSTAALGMELATLVSTIANSGSAYANGLDSLLSSDGVYNLTLSSDDLAFSMNGERVDTVEMTVPVDADLTYPQMSTLISDGVQLIDYDAQGDAMAATLQSSYDAASDTLSYDLTATGLGLNRTNLDAVLDPQNSAGHQPMLKFQFGDITGTSGDVNFELAGTTDSGSAFTIAFDLTLNVSNNSGVYTISTPGGTITPTATIAGNAVDLSGFTLSNADLDQFIVMGNAANQSPELTLKLESLLSQLDGNSTIQTAAEQLLAQNGTYTLTVSAKDGTDTDTDPDLSFTMDGQPVTTVAVTLPVSDALNYPVTPLLVDDGVQLIDYDATGDVNAATLQTSYNGTTDTLSIDLDSAGLGLNRTNLDSLADGTGGTSPSINFHIDGLLVDSTVQVRQSIDSGTTYSDVATVSLELDLTKTDFIYGS